MTRRITRTLAVAVVASVTLAVIPVFAQQPTTEHVKPERTVAPPSGALPPVFAGPPMPYAVCLSYCTREKLSFLQCHNTCKELVWPTPQTPNEGR